MVLGLLDSGTLELGVGAGHSESLEHGVLLLFGGDSSGLIMSKTLKDEAEQFQPTILTGSWAVKTWSCRMGSCGTWVAVASSSAEESPLPALPAFRGKTMS